MTDCPEWRLIASFAFVWNVALTPSDEALVREAVAEWSKEGVRELYVALLEERGKRVLESDMEE